MSVLLPGRNIVLIGMMGSGKTTVGRLLATRLERPFVDTDELVEREAGASVADIFADRGERRFRDLEAEVIRGVTTLRGQVISVGGGAITDDHNVTELRGTGDIVYLDAPAEELAARLAEQAGGRPLLAQAPDPVERLREILAARIARYRSAASRHIDTARKTPEEIADEIFEWARRQPGLLAREEREL